MLNKIVPKSASIIDILIIALAALSGIIVVFLMFATSIDTILRYAFNNPSIWLNEACEISIVALAFFGAAWVLKKDGHIKIDILTNIMNPKLQTMFYFITSIISAAICFAVTWYGIQVSLDYFQRNVYSMSVVAFPMYPRYVVIAVGSFFFGIEFLRKSYEYLTFFLKRVNMGKDTTYRDIA